MKYRKKPLVIDAVQWTGLNLEEVKTFAKGSLDVEIFDTGWKVGVVKPSVKITIRTLEGDMIVNSGDYIIKGVGGEFYPCKPDIFSKTYEKVDAMIEAQPTVGQWNKLIFRDLTDEEKEDYSNQEWTYIIESLPDYGEEVLVTDGKRVWTDSFEMDDFVYLESGADVDNCVAWQPLPAPMEIK